MWVGLLDTDLMPMKCSWYCVCMCHLKVVTDLVEEQDEIESEGDEQGQEPKVVEVARKVVLGDGGGIKKWV